MVHERAEWFEEQRCMIDDYIDNCDCERLRDDFTALRTKYHEHGLVNIRRYIRLVNMILAIEEAIKTDSRCFVFGYVDLKMKRGGYSSVMISISWHRDRRKFVIFFRNSSSERMRITHSFRRVSGRKEPTFGLLQFIV
jgi:hypothetical protein